MKKRGQAVGLLLSDIREGTSLEYRMTREMLSDPKWHNPTARTVREQQRDIGDVLKDADDILSDIEMRMKTDPVFYKSPFRAENKE